jgi:tyrosine-protein kinase Etk/Wzc
MNQFQSLGEVVAALRRRAWVILVVTLIGCVFSVFYALGQAKVYEATAVVQIEDSRVSDTVAGAVATTNNASRRLQLIEQRLMSRDNLLRIMEKHNLFNEVPNRALVERIYLMRTAARIEEIVTPSPVYSAGGNAPSGLMITVALTDPQKAADLANELMASVIEQSRDRSVTRARETLEFFATEEARVSGQIEAQEARIAQFKKANADQLPAGVSDLRTQLASLRATDLELDQQIIEIETAAGRQRSDVTQRQIALMQEQKALIAQRVSELETLIAGAPDVERDLNRLEREMVKLQDQYSVITRRMAEAEMGQALQDRQATGRFEVLETALVPEAPVSPSRKKLAMMGGVASLLAALALAFVLELMNPAIRNAQQMERLLGVEPVVAIPVVSNRRDRMWNGLRFVATGFGLFALIGALVAALASLAGRGVLPRRATES